MENPYWKRIYDEAPSDELKEYYRIMFDYYSMASARKPTKTIEEKLQELLLFKHDIEYLKQHTEMPQAKGLYQRALDKLAGEEEVGVYASCFRAEIRNPWYKPEDQH